MSVDDLNETNEENRNIFSEAKKIKDQSLLVQNWLKNRTRSLKSNF